MNFTHTPKLTNEQKRQVEILFNKKLESLKETVSQSKHTIFLGSESHTPDFERLLKTIHLAEHQLKLYAIETVLPEFDYWGSEDDIELGNCIYTEMGSLLGYDLEESDFFSGWCLKATADEIAASNLAVLLELKARTTA